MDLSKLDKIKTPEGWIADTLTCKPCSKKRRMRPRVAVSVIICIIALLFATTVSAATIPSVRQWLLQQFDNKAEVTKLSGYTVTKGNFFIKNNKIYRFDKGRLTELSQSSVTGVRYFRGKEHAFDFEYVKNGNEIYVSSKSSNILSISSFNSELAVIWLDMGDLWNSYFVDLKTGDTKPVVNESAHTVTEGILKLATDVEVSEDQKYLLYRSNRYTSKTDGNKGEWFIQEVATGEETRLEKAPIELFSKEIGFIDGSHVAIAYDEQLHPMVYDCKTDEYTVFDSYNGGEFANTLICYEGYKDGEYLFKDLYKDKTYKIRTEITNAASIVTREFICFLSPEGNADVYIINADKTVSFKMDNVSDAAAVTSVISTEKNSFAFVTDKDVYIVDYGA